jgi:hypothetical protein
MIESKVSQASTEQAAEAKPRMETSEAENQDTEAIRVVIAVAAYYRAERRNFEPGHELEDWLDAEAEVRAQTGSMRGFPA